MSKFIKFSISFTVPKDKAEHETTLESIEELKTTIASIRKKLIKHNKEDKWHIGWQDLGWDRIPTVSYDEVEVLEEEIARLKNGNKN